MINMIHMQSVVLIRKAMLSMFGILDIVQNGKQDIFWTTQDPYSETSIEDVDVFEDII